MSYSIKEFEKIYRSCFPPALRLAVSMLHDEEEARDVVQDTFVKLWESDVAVKNVQAYIIRAVRNACLNRIKATDIKERFKMGLSLEEKETDLDDDNERRVTVNAAIESLLSTREKQVVTRVFSDGMSYKEAARSLNVSVALINKNIVSALKTLRSHLSKKSS